ncbi:isoprenylcysteine carboxylmethyltransferase family protein [candidate division WOR-3 bacterium]|nr:isoprenylcysteine carboxylmethyltransferase family protein [candidate division WOR-3 bacterium]
MRTIFNILHYKNHPLSQNKKIIFFIYVIMAFLWFSWFQMCFFDPLKINVPVWLRCTGLLLFITGILLFLFSNMKLKEDKTGKTVTSGIYSKIRNPMYLGFIIWLVGFPLFLQSTITLLSSVIWISFIIHWKILEENELEKKDPKYREYKNKTWF